MTFPKGLCYTFFGEAGTAPITKNEVHLIFHRLAIKGETPIIKNVAVTDELGNEYEATYPKRAKGLVKKGRARFVSENRICLACPPNWNLEESITMSEVDNIKSPLTPLKNGADPEIGFKPQPEESKNIGEKKLTVGYLLEQIEKIAAQTEYLNQAMSELRQMENAGPGDMSTVGKSQALSKIVTCRETTNQTLIRFYEKLYDDIKPAKAPRDKIWTAVQAAVDNGCLDEFDSILDNLRHILNE